MGAQALSRQGGFPRVYSSSLLRTCAIRKITAVCIGAFGLYLVYLSCTTHYHRLTFAHPEDNARVTAVENVIEPTWSCHVLDQLSYCVYFHSLCLDENAELVLITRDSTRHDQHVELSNHLGPSPWHFPDLGSVSETAFGRYDVPFRSFFKSAKYSISLSKKASLMKGWSLVADFDSDNYNIYHYVNTMHASFIARLYELAGLKDRSFAATSGDILKDLSSPSSAYDHAYLFRPSPTSWQKNYGELCLGNKTKISYSPHNDHISLPVCFEKAIIPGAAIYLADGLASSVLFRELAALVKHVRVPEKERNFITIFDRSSPGNRRILNLPQLTGAVQQAAPGLNVTVVDWDGEVDFHTQAMHMARTRMIISTHSSALNHNMFMEVAGVVLEINAYQFVYPAANQVVISRGNYYFRYEESLENTRHQGMDFGHDPFPNFSSRECMQNDDCLLARRDADVKVNVSLFMISFRQALSLVM